MTINDSHIDPQMTFRKLVFLNMQQLTNFPYIEKDFDALTDYQLLCKVVQYLNMVIKNSNDQNDSITNLYNAFISLQDYVNTNFDDLETAFNNLQTFVTNYFDNLDVQEEINNKLDDMLESGQLEQIIEQFIQSTALWCFDTVADMKLATNFVNGSFAKTLGYYSVNDGGSATYKIRTKTNDDVVDEATIIDLYDNTLIAELILEDEIKVKQFGAYGDNIHDDTTAIQNAIDYTQEKNGVLLINNGVYKITTPLTITKSFVLKGTYSKGETTTGYLGSEIIQATENTNLINFTTNSIYNMQIRDIRFKGNGGRGLNVDGIFFSEYTFDNIIFNGGFTDALYLDQATIGNISNCVISTNTGGINLANASGIIFINNNFWNNRNYGIKFGTVSNCYFLKNWFENDNTRQYPNLLFQAPTNVGRCVFESCGFQNSGKENIKVDYITNITEICRIINTTFNDCNFQCSNECAILINNNDGNGNRNSNANSYFAENTFNNSTFNRVQNYCVKTDYEQINMLFNNCNVYSNYGYGDQNLTNSQTNKISTKTENNRGLLVNSQFSLENIKHTGLLRTNSIYMTNNRPTWRDNDNKSSSLALLKSGASTDRPVTPERGTCYFDTTINKPIWFNHNNQWVDGTGTVV